MSKKEEDCFDLVECSDFRVGCYLLMVIRGESLTRYRVWNFGFVLRMQSPK